MAEKGPLDDAIAVLECIKRKYPELNAQVFAFGRMELTFKDGVVFSIGPNPYLIRGKDFHTGRDFHVERKELDK